MITNIPRSKLEPHPDNPRKDLGDLSDLAASIKRSGVLQNLTVVPSPAYPDMYRIVIGHRRHAAAGLAGVDELPCSIEEMDLPTQIATMIAENMQRSDLTITDQVGGIQTMMDLGINAKGIAERTGLSATTVRKRMKLTEINPALLSETVKKGATLMDLTEIANLDADLRDQMLNEFGSTSYTWKLNQAKETQKARKNIPKAREALSKWAKEIDQPPYNLYQGSAAYERTIELQRIDEEELQRPDAPEDAEFVFYISGSRCTVYRIGDSAVERKQDEYYICPECGAISYESEIKRQPAKWIAENPEAYANGTRSFWLNTFVSPWLSWEKIILKYLEAIGNPRQLQVVYNTLFGELWEDRGGLEDEDTYMSRREEYTAELPDGVLVLTCGVDNQDDRLEFEVVGYGFHNETWGIRRGQIMGRPDDPNTWAQLDDILTHVYRFADGKGLRISMTLVDEGGHFTQDVRYNCQQRIGMKVFDCKGFYGTDRPYTAPPKKMKIVLKGRYIGTCWQYQLGVDAGKQNIMDNLRVQSPGSRYCHFPLGEERGYGHAFFMGLLSEHLVYKEKSRHPWQWEKIPGHERNEPLDCRNYANAAFKVLSPDMDAIFRRLKGISSETPPKGSAKPKKSVKRGFDIDKYFD